MTTLEWTSQSDFDGERDVAGMVHDADHDHPDAGTLAQGYHYGPLSDLYSTLYGSNLVGWWPLNEDAGDARDLSGSDNHGTVTGATRGVGGRGGLQAYSFDGSDDVVVIGDSSALDLGGARTLAAWIRSPDIAGGNHPVIQKGGYTATQDDYEYWFGPNSNDTTFFRVSDNSSHIVDVQVTTSDHLSDNTWHHIAAVWDGTTNTDGAAIFFDGSQVATDTADNTNAQTGTDKLRLGSDDGSDALAYSYMEGLICDARVYDTALTSAQIQTLYEWGSKEYAVPPDNNDGGQLYYDFNTSNVTDQWGSHDGTVTGATHVASGGPRGDGAYSFDGSDDRITASHSLASMFDSDFTIAFWILVDSTSGDSRMPFAFNTGTSSALTPRFRVRSGANGQDIQFQIKDESSNFHSAIAASAYVVGSWVHVVGTKDTTDGMRIYINGAVDGANSHTGTADVTDSDDLQLGGGTFSGFSGQFDGDLDEVRIYNYALSPHEVFELYQFGTFGRDLRAHTVGAVA